MTQTSLISNISMIIWRSRSGFTF